MDCIEMFTLTEDDQYAIEIAKTIELNQEAEILLDYQLKGALRINLSVKYIKALLKIKATHVI